MKRLLLALSLFVCVFGQCASALAEAPDQGGVLSWGQRYPLQCTDTNCSTLLASSSLLYDELEATSLRGTAMLAGKRSFGTVTFKTVLALHMQLAKWDVAVQLEPQAMFRLPLGDSLTFNASASTMLNVEQLNLDVARLAANLVYRWNTSTATLQYKTNQPGDDHQFMVHFTHQF